VISDLLAIVPRMFAESLAPRDAVRIWELPDVGPAYEVRMLWHASASDDAAHAWLRSVVMRLFRRHDGGQAAARGAAAAVRPAGRTRRR
jgi:DNA-binding transcriptional LysR family regulator